MRRVSAAARFVWEFVGGDDWRIAVGVVPALGLTALVAAAGVAAWWIMPLAAAGLLATSVWLAVRPRSAPVGRPCKVAGVLERVGVVGLGEPSRGTPAVSPAGERASLSSRTECWASVTSCPGSSRPSWSRRS